MESGWFRTFIFLRLSITATKIGGTFPMKLVGVLQFKWKFDGAYARYFTLNRQRQKIIISK